MNVNNFLDDDGLKAELYGAEEVVGTACTMCYWENGSVNTYSYTDNLIACFSPELDEGRWLNTSDKTDELEIVISQNEYGWKTGDLVNLSFSHQYGITSYSFRVVGVLKENAKIPRGYTNYSEINFTQFYRTYSYEIEECPMILMNLEDLKGLHDGPDILRAITAGCIITFSTDISEEQLEQSCCKLSSLGSVVIVPLKTMRENNLGYLYRQMYDLLP